MRVDRVRRLRRRRLDLLFDWIGNQSQVTDGDTRVTISTRDDLGRVVKLWPQYDWNYATVQVYDAASRLVTKVENFAGGANVKTHTFTFDNLGRLLDSEYAGTCGGSTSHPEIQQVYDTPPVSCPAATTCNRTGGRLAYVKVSLMCSTGLGTDYSLDQETFYSYDDAGRMIREYIRDDGGRTADHQYAWTKNGALAQVTTPSSAVIGWTYGSAASNSDTDLITAQWRTSIATPVTDTVQWFPYGPLQRYYQENTVASVGLQTRIARNLAYRITGVYVENKTQTTTLQSVGISEDAKGRVITRDYFPNTGGVQDSYFLYDQQDRVLCETTSLVASCPRTTNANIKNSHISTPEFTASGDWKTLFRPIPGTTGQSNQFNPSGPPGSTHRLQLVRQSDGSPILGDTNYVYNVDGTRSNDDNSSTQSNDNRDYAYDVRHNVSWVETKYFPSGTWNYRDTTSAFDAKNRRVFKSVYNLNTNQTATWYFYYDPLDRLTEVRYTPDTSASSTYSLFQLFWLGDRLTAYWQTDYPSVTTSKRYVGTDETNRPIDMMSWPVSGDAARVWAVNPSAWGFDTNAVGPTLYQPILFAGQYQDPETAAYMNDGATVHRSGLALNGFRTYDPFTGGYLQVDPLVPQTWSSYVYVDSDPVGRKDPMGLADIEHTYVLEAEPYAWGDCYDLADVEGLSACLGPGGWGNDEWNIGTGGGGGGGGYSCDPFKGRCTCACHTVHQRYDHELCGECEYSCRVSTCIEHTDYWVCDEKKLSDCIQCTCMDHCRQCDDFGCWSVPADCDSPLREAPGALSSFFTTALP